MDLVVLLAIFCLVAYLFWRAARSVTLYYKQIRDGDDSLDKARQEYPVFFVYAKYYAPVLIACFYLCSIGAMLAFCYVLVRWLLKITG